MNLAETTVLVTGATGGIGASIVEALLARGASVLATGRSPRALDTLASRCSRFGRQATFVMADLLESRDRERLCAAAIAANGGAGVNVLINGAGVGRFGLFEQISDAEIEHLLAINVAAPLQLTRALLAQLRRQPAAAIVNIGSVLGAIGYPGQAAYSATKFAMRGFSEALGRELADSPVRVLHVAPRATRTSLNTAAVDRMNRALRVAIDSPAIVAGAICRALEDERRTSVLGWPERLYVRINAVAPSIVDRSLASMLPVIKAHAADAFNSRTHP
jgi:short-subunit dehydrogenase